MNNPFREPAKPAKEEKPPIELRFAGNGCYVLHVAGREVAALRMFSHEASILEKLIRDNGGRVT